MKRGSLFVFAAVAGCLLDRLVEVRTRLCHFDENVRVTAVGGLQVDFLHPVLLEQDVVWLVGEAPAWVDADEDERVLHYVVERVGAPTTAVAPIPVWLSFRPHDEEWRLAELGVAGHLADALSVSLVDQGLRAVCAAQEDLAARQVAFDLAGVDRSTLPARSAWVAELGEPEADGSYLFRWTGSPRTAVVLPRFGAAGELQSLRVRYLRYRLDADFGAARATLALDRQP
jgi:hypothetical protein